MCPDELEYALQDHVDTTAIEGLGAMEDSRRSLEFEVPDHEVAVFSEGRILVDGSLQRVAAVVDVGGRAERTYPLADCGRRVLAGVVVAATSPR